MPTFEFDALDAHGKTISDQVNAPDRRGALARIRKRGLVAMRLAPKKVEPRPPRRRARPARRRTLAVGGVSGRDLTTFTRQLSSLTEAEIPLVRALDVLEGQARSGRLKDVVGSVAERVRDGADLGDALAAFPRTFGEVFCSVVGAGESGGRLKESLQWLAESRRKADCLRTRVAGAMLYPVVLLVVMSIILGLVVAFIMPNYTALFEELGIELPGLTMLVVDASRFCTERWFLLPLILLCPVAVYKASTCSRIGRHAADRLKFHLPLFGVVFRNASIARFTRTFGILLGSGVSILEALDISRRAAGNRVLAEGARAMCENLRRGWPLAISFGEVTVYGAAVAGMINVGEQTGRLGPALIKVAESCEADVDESTEQIGLLAEPVLFVCAAVLIGFVIIALYLPFTWIMPPVLL